VPWRGPEESVPARDRPHGTVRPGRVDRPGWCAPMVPQRQVNELPPPAVVAALARSKVSRRKVRKTYTFSKAWRVHETMTYFTIYSYNF
jgi:hypothetical protein